MYKLNIVRIVGKRSGSPENRNIEIIQGTSKWKKLKGFKKQLIFPETEKKVRKNVVDKTFSDIYDKEDFGHNN